MCHDHFPVSRRLPQIRASVVNAHCEKHQHRDPRPLALTGRYLLYLTITFESFRTFFRILARSTSALLCFFVNLVPLQRNTLRSVDHFLQAKAFHEQEISEVP